MNVLFSDISLLCYSLFWLIFWKKSLLGNGYVNACFSQVIFKAGFPQFQEKGKEKMRQEIQVPNDFPSDLQIDGENEKEYSTAPN